MSTHDFPAEILVKVFCLLKPDEIKMVRRVSRRFEEISRRFFRVCKVIIGSQTETLDRLIEISESNKFRNGIHTACFITLPAILPENSPDPKYTQNFQTILDNESGIRREGYDRDRITEAFRRMPNIKRIELSNIQCATHDSLHPMKGQFNAEYHHELWSVDMSPALELIISAVKAAQIEPTTLTQLSGVIEKSLSLSIAEITSLKTLQLRFDDRCLPQEHEIANSLQPMANLESLTLRYEDRYGEEAAAFTRVLFNTWPKLSHIYIDFDVEYITLLSFLQRHKRSLRSFKIEYMVLHGGTWTDLLEEMRACLELKDVYLKCLYEATHDKLVWGNPMVRIAEAERYMIHGGENPLRNGVVKFEPEPRNTI
jgi:hypothetical protein